MHPAARRTDVIVQHIGDETLVYDRLRDAVHSLNPVAAHVFAHADGTRSVAQIARGMSAALGTEDAVRVTEAALWRLEGAHLLDAPDANGPGRRAVTRRDAVRRLGAALAIPVVTSLVAPTPAMALSGGPGGQSSLSPASVTTSVGDHGGGDDGSGGGTSWDWQDWWNWWKNHR